MLAELSIKNFAIIESLSLSFDEGLTVFTGETGAGKSIIIDAIQLLSGGRGSAEFVRHGETKAELEGLFFVAHHHPVMEKLQELDIDVSEGMVVVQRNISHTGKSVCRINSKLVTLGILREIGGMLIDIHSQHEHQGLMQPETHVTLLDEYGSETIAPVYAEYERLYKQYRTLQNEQQKLTENEKQIAERLDLITYQLNEIKQAGLQPQEEENLLAEKRKLANYEKLYEATGKAYESLSQDDKGLDWVGKAMAHLEDIAGLDADLEAIHETVSSSFYNLQETVFSLRQKLDELESDPERLNAIEERLNEISRLKRKYGDTIEQVLQYADAIEKEMKTLTNREEQIEAIQQQIPVVAEKLTAAGEKLRNARKKAAQSLTQQIHAELKSLHMDQTTFTVNFDPVDSEGTEKPLPFRKDGIDVIEFFISTNTGEPLKPLAKVASGGELSRIMLALKTIFANREATTSMIFDEIDTGVSGRVAQAMAEKIQRLSVSSQVFCITHLPQIAAMADDHLYISKRVTDTDRTITKVTPLATQEKVKEIGRMISGVEVTELTKKHAEELIELAAKMKSIS